MSIDPKAVVGFIGANPMAAGLALVAALIVFAIVWWAGRGITHALRGKQPEDILTFLVAGLCTAISAQGMFKFFSDKLSMPWWMTGLGFCVFEVAQVTFALRARRQIKDDEAGGAGINGVLVWVMAAISAVLSATDAAGWGAPARMVFPFVAAIAWELGLVNERRRTGKRAIQWTVGLERILVRLGLADSAHRSVGEVDTHRRLNTAAVATYRMDLLRASKWQWRKTRASRKQNAAMQDLMASTDYASNPATQDKLRTMVAILKGAASLADLNDPPPWARPDPMVAVFDTARVRFAPLIAGAPIAGTELPAGTGTGTEDMSEETPDTGTETGIEGGTEPGIDTGSEGGSEGGSDAPRKTGTQRRSRTGTRKRATVDRGTLLARARKLNAAHLAKHGRPISGGKLAAELHVSKSKALGLLAEIKRPRAVRSDGAA